MPYTKQNFVDGQTLTAPQMNTMEAGIQTADAGYQKQNFVNGQTLTAAQLNHMEDGIATANNKPAGKPEESKTVRYTANGTNTVLPSSGKTMSSVRVEVAVPSSGGDTADATATADNIEYGFSAYAKGSLLNGTLRRVQNTDNFMGENLSEGLGVFGISAKLDGSARRIVSPQDKLTVQVERSLFGDATAADIRVGKTATSASGLKIAGTMRGGNGGLPDTITAGDTPYSASFVGGTATDKTKPTKIGLGLTVPKAGTWRVKVCAFASGLAGSPSVMIYKNGASVHSTTVSGNTTDPISVDLTLAQGDKLEVWGQAAGAQWSSTNVTAQSMILCYQP